MIQNAGGVAVLAHPHQLKLENDALEAMVVRLKAAGLQGIEAYYSRHTPSQTQFYLHLAEKYDLLYTCGSDYHGPVIKPDIALGTGISNNLGICDEKFRNGCLRQSLQNVPLDILGDSYYNRQRF